MFVAQKSRMCPLVLDRGQNVQRAAAFPDLCAACFAHNSGPKFKQTRLVQVRARNSAVLSREAGVRRGYRCIVHAVNADNVAKEAPPDPYLRPHAFSMVPSRSPAIARPSPPCLWCARKGKVASMVDLILHTSPAPPTN